MEYISFYKDRLPFKPKTNVVIYFDVTGIGMKYYYDIINQYYDRIVLEFQLGGLEFCFMPRIAEGMELEKIYRYFNPEAAPDEYLPKLDVYRDTDLLEYIVAGYDERDLKPGLIQYMGEGMDKEDTYTYAYTPLPPDLNHSLFEQLHYYIREHGISNDFFGSSSNCEVSLSRVALDKEAKSNMCSSVGSTPHIDFIEERSVEDMMSEVQMLVEQLRKSGVGEIALQRLFKPTQKLSRMHIQYGRIFLPDYHNMEIKMPPLSKAIYLLFLRYPEGIMFSYLPDYRRELLQLYELISGRDNRDDIRRSIDDVTDPTRNSINEKCSRIKQAFLREFDDSIAQNYYITGGRGEAKKILLPRNMVTWNMPD